MRKLARLLALVLAAVPAFSSGIVYTCASNIGSTVWSTLNTTIAGLYSSVFTDANAAIYIQYGSTGLGESEQYYDTVTYSSYYNALSTHESGANDVAAVASLTAGSNPVVSGDGVAVTSALAGALGLSGATGITTSDTSCTIGGANCYNTIITITSDSSLLYYRNGSQGAGQYDFFSVVEHETDEALGTVSCLTTSVSNAPEDGCTNAVSAADLFRYSATGTRSFLGSGGDQANGTSAYFSTNGGATHIAAYNNSPNGADYGDWSASCTYIQDAYGCPGSGGGLNITNDGGVEIAVLDAVGYNLTAYGASVDAPEPGTILLSTVGLGVLAGLARRRRRASQ